MSRALVSAGEDTKIEAGRIAVILSDVVDLDFTVGTRARAKGVARDCYLRSSLSQNLSCRVTVVMPIGIITIMSRGILGLERNPLRCFLRFREQHRSVVCVVAPVVHLLGGSTQ